MGEIELDRWLKWDYGVYMFVFRQEKPLVWGELDLHLLGISHDWYGEVLEPMPMYALVEDLEFLWLVGSCGSVARSHPEAKEGKFLAELWRYDVVEVFLGNPETGRYWEVNLSPSGGWWACEFCGPRVRVREGDVELAGVRVHAVENGDGTWLSMVGIPLGILRDSIDYGEGTCGNVTMILGSPEQRFVTVADLGEGEPDFHLPERFVKLEWICVGM